MKTTDSESATSEIKSNGVKKESLISSESMDKTPVIDNRVKTTTVIKEEPKAQLSLDNAVDPAPAPSVVKIDGSVKVEPLQEVKSKMVEDVQRAMKSAMKSGQQAKIPLKKREMKLSDDFDGSNGGSIIVRNPLTPTKELLKEEEVVKRDELVAKGCHINTEVRPSTETSDHSASNEVLDKERLCSPSYSGKLKKETEKAEERTVAGGSIPSAVMRKKEVGKDETNTKDHKNSVEDKKVKKKLDEEREKEKSVEHKKEKKKVEEEEEKQKAEDRSENKKAVEEDEGKKKTVADGKGDKQEKAVDPVKSTVPDQMVKTTATMEKGPSTAEDGFSVVLDGMDTKSSSKEADKLSAPEASPSQGDCQVKPEKVLSESSAQTKEAVKEALRIVEVISPEQEEKDGEKLHKDPETPAEFSLMECNQPANEEYASNSTTTVQDAEHHKKIETRGDTTEDGDGKTIGEESTALKDKEEGGKGRGSLRKKAAKPEAGIEVGRVSNKGKEGETPKEKKTEKETASNVVLEDEGKQEDGDAMLDENKDAAPVKDGKLMSKGWQEGQTKLRVPIDRRKATILRKDVQQKHQASVHPKTVKNQKENSISDASEGMSLRRSSRNCRPSAKMAEIQDLKQEKIQIMSIAEEEESNDKEEVKPVQKKRQETTADLDSKPKSTKVCCFHFHPFVFINKKSVYVKERGCFGGM